MWIRKGKRDVLKGVDSPMPTQLVSNEEFIPRPQNRQQKQVEHLIGEMAEEKSKKLGMDRRTFMGSALGLATCFLAQNKVYGKIWDVDEVESMERAAYDEKWPKNEYFIIDVQSHFTNGFALNFRTDPMMKGMGFNLKNDADAYSFNNFVKEMYFDSETMMCVISGVPPNTPERYKDENGNLLQGRARGGGILPSWLMGQSAKKLNEMAGSQRALCQGNLAPNHYWDKVKNVVDKQATIDQMERELHEYNISSWKWYCHSDPGRTGNGFQLDDENSQWFYEESRKRGMKLISVHKGYSYQSRTLGHLANPKDVEKAALNNPDFNFVVYHSAIEHGPNEPNWAEADKFDPTTGDFEWHNILMDIKKRNPKMNNVYCEIGSFFGVLVIANPIMCMHGIGKNIKHYGADHVIWGTDCLWWGSPQWVIDAFKRFNITEEFCEKFGYKPLTNEDKAKIFGLNAARLYKVDVKAKRNQFPNDTLEKLKAEYIDKGGVRSNLAYGWVRAND
ncbi:MAG TPA: amidohydrolase family protein [Blastocatellia bacterium]|nr:amidohydrolase family protein [Blastocatellia bacterium]